MKVLRVKNSEKGYGAKKIIIKFSRKTDRLLLLIVYPVCIRELGFCKSEYTTTRSMTQRTTNSEVAPL